MFSPPGGPTLKEPSMVPRVDPAAISSPVTNTAEEGSSLASKGHDLVSPAKAVELSCVAPQREILQLLASVT